MPRFRQCSDAALAYDFFAQSTLGAATVVFVDFFLFYLLFLLKYNDSMRPERITQEKTSVSNKRN